jgi:hypothetical protein
MLSRAKNYASELLKKITSIPEKISAVGRTLYQNYEPWFNVHKNRLINQYEKDRLDINKVGKLVRPASLEKVQNPIDYSFPNSLANHLRRAFAFAFGESDKDHREYVRQYMKNPEPGDWYLIMDRKWTRFLNPFHWLNFGLGALKSTLLGGIDWLDRYFCGTAASLHNPESSLLAKSLKGFLYVVFGVIEPLIQAPLKIAGDLLDFFVLDRASDLLDYIGECCGIGVSDDKDVAKKPVSPRGDQVEKLELPADVKDQNKARLSVPSVARPSSASVAHIAMTENKDLPPRPSSAQTPRSAELHSADDLKKAQLKEKFRRHRKGLKSRTLSRLTPTEKDDAKQRAGNLTVVIDTPSSLWQPPKSSDRKDASPAPGLPNTVNEDEEDQDKGKELGMTRSGKK